MGHVLLHEVFHLLISSLQEAYSVARQFNMIPPVCEQAEYHLFQREKVEVQLPELYHKIGKSETAVIFGCFVCREKHRAALGLCMGTPLSSPGSEGDRQVSI